MKKWLKHTSRETKKIYFCTQPKTKIYLIMKQQINALQAPGGDEPSPQDYALKFIKVTFLHQFAKPRLCSAASRPCCCSFMKALGFQKSGDDMIVH